MSDTFEGVGEECVTCGGDASYFVTPTIKPTERDYTCGRHLAASVDRAATFGLVTVVSARSLP